MAFNIRKQRFLEKLQFTSAVMNKLYSLTQQLKESYDEEFAAGQDNDLSVDTEELANLGLEFADIMAVCNQAFNGYNRFFTNQPVTSREYGKDVRRVMSLNQEVIRIND